MLLRNRSRAMNKPTLMADHSSNPSPKPNHNYARTIPSLFCSPKFRDFTMKCLAGAEALPSPTSILDTRTTLSPFGNPFSYDNNRNEATISPRVHSGNRSSLDKIDSKGIGLALVGALKDEPIDENCAKPISSGNVLFGTQLRVKIPPLSPCAADFGTKNKDSQDSGLYATKDSSSSPQGVVGSSGFLSLSEMELSEEYTCVIYHGPNPRTTHIFDNFIVESYCSLPNNNQHLASVNFLSFCYTCKKHLEQTKDIFIYRYGSFFYATFVFSYLNHLYSKSTEL